MEAKESLDGRPSQEANENQEADNYEGLVGNIEAVIKEKKEKVKETEEGFLADSNDIKKRFKEYPGIIMDNVEEIEGILDKTNDSVVKIADNADKILEVVEKSLEVAEPEEAAKGPDKIDEKKSKLERIAENKINRMTVDTIYRTLSTVSGIKFLMDIGLTMTAAAGHLIAKLGESDFNEGVEKSIFMELAKGNDVYSYFHDLLSDKGARNLRNNIKKEFISLPAGAEEIEEKINTVKDKIETSKLTDEQKVKYLNKLKEVLEKSEKENKANKDSCRHDLKTVTEAFIQNQVSAINLSRSALNLGFMATGLVGARLVSFFGSMVAQRIEKAKTEYARMLVADKEKMGISNEKKFILKNLFIDSVKETAQGLLFSKTKKGKEQTKIEKWVNFIEEVGTVTRSVGIGAHIGEMDFQRLIGTMFNENNLGQFSAALNNNLEKASNSGQDVGDKKSFYLAGAYSTFVLGSVMKLVSNRKKEILKNK